MYDTLHWYNLQSSVHSSLEHGGRYLVGFEVTWRVAASPAVCSIAYMAVYFAPLACAHNWVLHQRRAR